MKRRISRGSLTVEAALIVPAAWFCVVLLIALNFYVHNKVWFQAAAYEAALAGNGREAETGEDGPGELASEKLEARIRERIMPGEAPETVIRAGKSGTEIEVAGQVLTAVSRGPLTFRVAAEAEKIRPVEFLKRYRVIKLLDVTE